MLRLPSECRAGTAGLAEESSSATRRIGGTYSIDPARGTDQVRTGCLQEGFGILEWEMFVLGNETLEFLAFSKS